MLYHDTFPFLLVVPVAVNAVAVAAADDAVVVAHCFRKIVESERQDLRSSIVENGRSLSIKHPLYGVIRSKTGVGLVTASHIGFYND